MQRECALPSGKSIGTLDVKPHALFDDAPPFAGAALAKGGGCECQDV